MRNIVVSPSLRLWLAIIAMLGTVVFSKAAEDLERSARDSFEHFAVWMEAFDQGKAETARGVELAKARETAMVALIQSDPERALERAIATGQRAKLPKEVAAHVERQVSGRGDLMVAVADDFEHGRSRTFRDATLNGETYRAFVYGERLERVSETEIPLTGIVLGKLMSVAN